MWDGKNCLERHAKLVWCVLASSQVVVEALKQLNSTKFNENAFHCQKVCFHMLLWHLWKLRNECKHNGLKVRSWIVVLAWVLCKEHLWNLTWQQQVLKKVAIGSLKVFLGAGWNWNNPHFISTILLGFRLLERGGFHYQIYGRSEEW